MFKFIRNIFSKKTEIEKEEKIEKEIIEEAQKEQETLPVSAIVIMYMYDDIEDSVPQISQICEFHNSLLPDKGSIIWAPNTDMTALTPYKVIRYDFIEDPEKSNNISRFVYIVVVPADNSDILIDY